MKRCFLGALIISAPLVFLATYRKRQRSIDSGRRMKELPNSGGLLVPDDFNEAAVEQVREIMASYSTSEPGPWKSFAAAWNGLAYRFRSADEYHRDFTTAMESGDAPLAEPRYQQERALFAFYAAALSTVECFSFATYCLGSIAHPTGFPMTKDRDLKFYPSDVAKRFAKELPGERITELLQTLIDAPEFTQLSDLRNVLSHRGTLPRSIHASVGTGAPGKTGAYVASNPKSLSSDWQFDQTVDVSLTLANRTWLSEILHDLLEAESEFVRAHLDKR
jgi:hypothetical protein